METVCVEMTPGMGIRFYKRDQDSRTLFHEVDNETLYQMSLDDLRYCIATNCFIELRGLHNIFEEYLWTDDGETEPRKKSSEPREGQ